MRGDPAFFSRNGSLPLSGRGGCDELNAPLIDQELHGCPGVVMDDFPACLIGLLVENQQAREAVSYTHLTLPTICSV